MDKSINLTEKNNPADWTDKSLIVIENKRKVPIER